LKITGSGTIKRGSLLKAKGLDIFQLESGSKLIIGEKDVNSTKKDKIVIDGEDVVVHRPLILAYNGGDVELNHVTLKNNRNRATAQNPAGNSFSGGAIFIAPSYKTVNKVTTVDRLPSLSLYSCSIQDCTSYSYGGGIYSSGCDINLINSEILRCNAVGGLYSTSQNTNLGQGILETNEGPYKGSYWADRGAGGGIKLAGIPSYNLRPTCTITNSNISYNTAVGYGGGVEINSGASVVMNSGSMNNNTSLNRGAGALHVTADASFTMNGGEMKNNVCYEVGGAIHTSYTCVLNLNAGVIENNIAYGRGGGVHIDVGGDLVLNGTDIINNEARDSVVVLDKDSQSEVTHTEIGVSNIVGGVYTDDIGKTLSKPIWLGNAQFRGDAGYGGGGSRTSQSEGWRFPSAVACLQSDMAYALVCQKHCTGYFRV